MERKLSKLISLILKHLTLSFLVGLSTHKLCSVLAVIGVYGPSHVSPYFLLLDCFDHTEENAPRRFRYYFAHNIDNKRSIE